MKTDRRDARKLARFHRAGELTAVHIPDVEDEVIRDVCRARTDAVNAMVRAKKQLLGFLLRNGYRYTGNEPPPRCPCCQHPKEYYEPADMSFK